MEKFTLKVGSMFFSKAFQFIIGEKCNIQAIFFNLTKTFAYFIKYIVISHACNDFAMLDLKPHSLLLNEVHLAY